MASLTPARMASVAVVAAGMIGAAHANLIVNGGFESGLTAWDSPALLDPPNVICGTPDPFSAPHSGNCYAAFFSVRDFEGIEQAIATIPGAQYSIQFYLANFGDDNNDFNVSFGGQTLLTLTDADDFPDYVLYSFNAVAAASTTTLLFQGRNPPDEWKLDDVSILLVSPPGRLPEPATAALLATVLGALGVWGRWPLNGHRHGFRQSGTAPL